jgi:O-acetyl-ADP-ribose deacetylase (regulator of RNase III)
MERVHTLSNGRRLRLLEGDITRVAVDAIANAANAALAGGGGVDGAIHRAGGPSIMAELDEIRPRIGRLPAGQAVATGAGRLPAKYVFHAVGPVYSDGKRGEPEALASCYRACLKLADERGCESISFPSISTGVYGYPIDAAARIALREILEHLAGANTALDEVVMVLFGARSFSAHDAALSDLTRQS